MTDAAHPLLGRRAVLEGKPGQTVHNYFLEGHWHSIFGEPERYELPCKRFTELPFVTGRVVPKTDGSCIGASCKQLPARADLGRSVER
eukprot:1054208-Prymnesium_polylepis.1